jgi:hypothetical protein
MQIKDLYHKKYLKYKNKYLNLQNQLGGAISLVIENDTSNFGHHNLIWEGNVSFIDPKTNQNLDKQKVIQENLDNGTLNPVEDQQKYFQLFRYGINQLKKPNYSDGPTLSISLFMPNDKLYAGDFSRWSIKYFQNQIILCLVFNYYFPNGNYRNYFDYYMLNIFEVLPGNDKSLILTQLITKFDYNDFEEEYGVLVNKFLEQYYNELKKYEDYPFTNGLERFIFTFDLACKCYNNNGELEIKEKTGDFFVYKFSGPFIENEGYRYRYSEGHITNGYIGQFIRYISLKQSSYLYKGQEIKKPSHFVWRDAHSNCIAFNDNLWIQELNKYKDKTIYFLPHSLGYIRPWHDYVKCDGDGEKEIYIRSPIAGVVQMINPKFSQDSNLYLKTIGLPFIIDLFKRLPLEKARSGLHKLRSYKYGIDEYILSSLFIEDEIKKYSIYFNYKLEDEIFNFSEYKYSNEKNYFYYLITAQVLILNILKTIDKPKIIDVIKRIEELREDKDIKNTALGFLLSMIPNKYHIGDILFSYSIPIRSIFDEPGFHKFSIYTTTLDLDYINNIYTNNNTEMIEKLKRINFDNFNFDTLKDFGINCTDNLIINSILEWCQHAYIKKLTPNTIDCTSANYYSGFYNEKPPSLDIGILRRPSDLEYAVDALYNNKLKLKLNKSDYKLNVKTKNLITDIKLNKDNYNIKPLLQIIIFNFSDGEKIFAVENIAMSAFKNLINQKQDSEKLKNLKSRLWSSLIWKALNYSGYDIPSEWFYIHLDDNEKYYQFNYYVKKLSKIKGWAEYALEVLIKDDQLYEDTIKEDFMSKIVTTKSKKYFDSSRTTDFNKYKMDTHDYK